MGRAHGKHGPRRGGPGDDDSGLLAGTPGERREEGIGDPRDIPGGRNHLANPPVTRQAVPVKPREWQFRRADLAHGVPPDEAGLQFRDPRLSGGQRGGARMAPPPPEPRYPVPVYIVEGEGGAGVTRMAYPRSVQCPASTAAEPVRVCGVNQNRVEVQLLNEDTATDIRFAATLGALASGSGALLPWPANTYRSVPTQGELWAIGATGSGTPRLSIIEVFEEPSGG